MSFSVQCRTRSARCASSRALCRIRLQELSARFMITGMIKIKQVRCSFCGKKEAEVRKLVAGPRVYICDECVTIAKEVIDHPYDEDHPSRVRPSAWRKLLACVWRCVSGDDSQRINSVIPAA